VAKYWFARRFPVGEVRNNRMGPVSSEGWAVVALFAGCMIAGGVGLFLFSFAYRQPFVGVVTMLVFALVGAAAFISLAYIKGDKAHTVDDYKAGRVRAP
jgi:hypothetical protein